MSSNSIGNNSLNKFILKNNNILLKNNSNVEYRSNTRESLTSKDSLDLIETKDLLLEKSYFLNRLDSYDGLFTTQQLESVDFSKFENHVFFDSAVDKVNSSFKKIINNFPYDSNRFDFDDYIKKLDGYTNYLLKKVFPNNMGYIKFDGSKYLEIVDSNGFILKDYKDKNKKGILNPGNKKFSFDFWIKKDVQTNLQNQILFQKINTINNILEEGYTLFIEEVYNINKKAKLSLIISDSVQSLKSSAIIDFDENFRHIHVKISSSKSKRVILFYQDVKHLDSEVIGELNSSEFTEFFNSSVVTIGKGSNHRTILNEASLSNQVNCFYGFLDELKFYKKSLLKKQISYQKDNPVKSTKSLLLYLKFNEISGMYKNNQVFLDSSGNKIHAILKDLDTGLISSQEEASSVKIEKTSSDKHIIYENKIYSPVIFPDYNVLKDMQNSILNEAKEYDLYNPNAFWKLLPKFIFEDASEFEGKNNLYFSNDLYKTKDNSIDITTPANNTIINLLIIWSRFFDQIKSYIDSITDFISVDYDDLNKKTINLIIPLLTKNAGFDFKSILSSPTKEKLDGKNLFYEEITSENGLVYIQNEIWKRILINTNDIVSSKGTKKSIKSILNSVGLGHDKFIEMREYSGFNEINLNSKGIIKNKSINKLDFFNSFNTTTYQTDAFDRNIDENFYPKNKIIFEINDVLNNNLGYENSLSFDYENDWSYESFYSYNNNFSRLLSNQCLLRIEKKRKSRTGYINNDKIRPYINLFFTRTNKTEDKGKLTLEISAWNSDEGLNDTPKGEKKIVIENVELINGKDFYICVRKKTINDKKDFYELICYQSIFPYNYTKLKSNSTFINYINQDNKEKNKNISNIQIGQIDNSIYTHAQSSELSNPIETNFEGEIFGLKLWSKFLTKKEVHRHMTDPYNFSLDNERKIEKLKINFSLNEKFIDHKNNLINTSISTNKFIFNNLLNEYHKSNNSNLTSDFEYSISVNPLDNNLISSNFTSINDFMKTKNKQVKKESYKIDEPNSFNNVVINSYEENYYKDINNNFLFNPSHNSNYRFEEIKENIFSLDFSFVKHLNEDISKLLSSTEFLSKELSDSSSLYDTQYININKARESYYKRLESNIDFKPMYQIFKYFDNILSSMLKDFVPSRVNYKGFNFVYESHILERHKYEYKMSQSRMPIVNTDLKFDFTKESNNNVYRNFNEIKNLNTNLETK